MSEYRIDELARVAGTTSRSIRSYQDRGLLPPPRREGRVGVYSEVHLGRLRLISSLLDRGYALAHIDELITAWEQGKDLNAVLGLEQAISSPWTDELPTYVTADDLSPALGGPDDGLLRRAVAAGMVAPDGERYRVPSPQLLNTFTELVGYGFDAERLLSLTETMLPTVDSLARQIVETGASHVLGGLGEAGAPSADELGETARLLARLRQLTTATVHAALAHALERNIQEVLGDHLAGLVGAPGPAPAEPA